MALLKVINGDSAGTTYVIGQGNLKVGRADGNDLLMPDGSVSSRHCELSLDGHGNLLVRDLGSTNGTYIEGAQVREPALALPGQRVRFGNLELLFEGDQTPAVSEESETVILQMPPPPAARPAGVIRLGGAVPAPTHAPMAVAPVEAAAAGPNDCANHPGTQGTLVCGRCGKKLCKQCVKQQKLGMKVVDFCLCGGQCKKASEAARDAAAAASIPKSFGTAVSQAFKYPFKGNGLLILICGTIFCTGMDFLSMFAFLYAIPLRVTLWGYLFAYMQKIVVCSAAGESEPPGWPEVSDIGSDIIQPFFQLLVVLVISFAPAVGVWISMGALPGQFTMLLGMIYFPMALLGLAMSDSYGSLNPVFVLSSVMKAPGNYIGTCLVFLGLVFMRIYGYDAISEIDIPIVPYFLYWFVFLVLLMIAMRILGSFYLLNRRKLNWGL